ncbi:hypothetical protein V1478_011014 [Vespula squamosa]|uniref:Uncharacterized protein n=1 Tax=Vespula squamosa TaxID=30214 RepID=A0ABD2AFZ3_VESSQ
MEWTWLKDWWRLKKWRYYNHGTDAGSVSGIRDVTDLDTCCYCDECFVGCKDLIMSFCLFQSHINALY